MAGNANDILVNLRFNYSEVNKAVNKINNSFKKLDGVASTVKKQQVEVSKMTQSLNNLGLAGNSVGGIFGKLFAKVGVWLGVTTVVYGLIRGVGALFSEMKSLEDATIRLQRVMVGNRDEIEANTRLTYDFAKSMSNLAAATYDETLVAMEETVKAGFRFADAMTLARTALLASNVTELSTADATRFLIATIRQFNLTATDSLSVLDQWNELGKRTGATSQGIAEAVSRSGLAFRSVGGTLAQLNAITAAVIETTGESGEKVGTSLKTISARYADLGRKMSLNNELSKHGINIQKANTREQDDFLTVMSKLRDKWDDLTKAQQANIAKSAAGIRQYTRFMAIVKNFDGVIRALLVTINSSNSALSENEVRAKSLDFKLKQLKGSFQEIALSSQGLLNVVKNLTDLLIPLVKTFGVITSNKITAGLLTTVGVFGTIHLSIMGLGKAIAFLLPLLGKLTLGGGPIGLAILAISVLAGWFLTAGSNARKLREDMKFAFSDTASDIKARVNNTRELIKDTELFLTLLKRKGTAPDIIESITQAYTDRGFKAEDLKTMTSQEIIDELNKQITPGNIIQSQMDELKKLGLLTEEVTKHYNELKNVFSEEGITPESGIVKIESKLVDTNKELLKYKKLKEEIGIMGNVEGFFNELEIKDAKFIIEEYPKLIKKGTYEESNGWLFGGGTTTKTYTDKQIEKMKEDIKKSQKLLDDYNKVYKDGVAMTPDMINNKIKELEIQTEIYNTSLSTLRVYTDSNEAHEQAQLEQEKLLAITKNIYSTWVDTLFELKEGQSLVDNIGNSFMEVGKIIYNEIKNSIVEGFVAGMEGIEAIATMKNTIKEFSQQFFMGVNNWFEGLNDMGDLPNELIVKMNEGKNFSPEEMFKYKKGDTLKMGIMGAGLGGFTASATGRDAGSGAGIGVITSLIGEMMLPGVGGIIGGLLGGLLAGGGAQENKDVDESLKYQRESTKELKEVNRNLVLMRQDLRPWEYISDSYFFSQATKRGFVGA